MRPDHTEKGRLHVLYTVYWGAMEPLGQALVVPPLLRFAERGLRITLVSCEKPEHMADRERLHECAHRLRAAGIRWLPLRYHRRPAGPATAWDIAQGCATGIIAALRDRPDVVHGRTYIGGVIGHRVSRILGRPFIFHNDGFWPDEQVEGGKWGSRDWRYRLTKRMELSLYRDADAVITLSEPARRMVSELRLSKPRWSTVVVPSCVDLVRFGSLPPRRQPLKEGQLVYLGSLGGRYRLDEMARFLTAVRREIPSAALTVYSQSSAVLIRSGMNQAKIPEDCWTLSHLPHTQIPHALRSQQAGLFFLARGLSSRGCSPTKIGEYWACGLPVVTTPDVGDVDGLIRRERVGVLVRDDTDDAYRGAARELRLLLNDPDVRYRCRRAAERHYSLDRAVGVQLQLYGAIA